MSKAAELGLADKRGVPIDGVAYVRTLTNEVRVWVRKHGWRSVLFARDGTVPLCYDPATGEAVALFGDSWRPVRLKPPV